MYERTRLTHVAIKFQGVVHSLPEPNRHSDIIYQMIRGNADIEYMDIHNNAEFGFLDEAGTFLNRKQAVVSAELFDQIKDPSKVLQGQLFSEALW